MIAVPFVPDGVWIPKAILTIASRFAVPLFVELRRHCYDRPECFPGHRRLARAIGCSIGTVNALTNQFNALGIIRKTHCGRHCIYLFGEGYWRRRKPSCSQPKARKTADCSAHRTEGRNNYVVPTDKRRVPKNLENSQRNALECRAQQRAERRAKRRNQIKTLRRWVEASPHLPEAERPHRLAVLDRAEGMLDDWYGRSPEDMRCYDLLAAQARRCPLDARIEQALTQPPQSTEANSLGALLARQGWLPAQQIAGAEAGVKLAP